jgi:tetratricopeptide (TPR) repeat protein
LRNTFVVVASHRTFDVASMLRGHNRHLKFWLLDESETAALQAKCGHVILTDDYAPVENMLAPVVRQSAKEILARRYLDDARRLQVERRFEASIAAYRQAVVLNPSMSIKAYNEIGLMQVVLDQPEDAANAFRAAVEYHTAADTEETAIASVHMNLGILLRRMGQPEEAGEQLRQAVRWFRVELEVNPNSVVDWDRLGDTLAVMGNFAGASEAFERATRLEPANPAHYQKLAKALEFQKRYDEAIDVVSRLIEALTQSGRGEEAAQQRQYREFLEYQKVKEPR